jgi:hypothetical protein
MGSAVLVTKDAGGIMLRRDTSFADLPKYIRAASTACMAEEHMVRVKVGIVFRVAFSIWTATWPL